MRNSLPALAGLLLAALLPLAPAHAQLTVAGGTLTLGPGAEVSVGGPVSIGSGATLDNQGTLRLTGDLLNTGAIGSGAGLWQLSGTTLQTLAAGGATLGTLNLANPAGATLSQPLTLGALQLGTGPLRLAALDLTVTGAIGGASATSFVETNGTGQLRRPVGTAAVLFPLGPADGRYRPLTVQRSTGTGTYAARAADQALGAGPVGTPFASHAVALHWDVTPPDAVPFDLTAQWEAADELPSFTRAASALARWGGSAYVPTAFGPATGAGPYQRSSAGLTAGGTFAVFDAGAPLPVELVRFEAQRPAGRPEVRLNWTTASELHNSGFEVQRQDAGQAAFHKVGFVAGQGTKATPTTYAFTDPNAFEGLSYYRLRQLDQNGAETFSPVRAVPGLPAGTTFSLSAFPNPASTTTALDATGPLPTDLTFTLLAADGRQVWQRLHAERALGAAIDVSQLAAGTYLLRYQAPDGTRGTLPLVVAR